VRRIADSAALKEDVMLHNWKNWQAIALGCSVILAPWLVGLAFGLELLVLTAVMTGLMLASLIGVAALVVLGADLLKSVGRTTRL
jgi:hypothetical protein